MAHVRQERPADFAAIRSLLERAFAPSDEEAGIVDGLRAAGDHIAALCLVAEQGDAVVGHIAFSRAELGSGHGVLALAPMAVAPEHQRSGIGTALIEEAMRGAAATRFPLVVVVGHPDYYPRFGFEPAGQLGIASPFDVPAEAFMAYRLPSYDPAARGMLSYAAAFGA
jgi:putative acetyltransferase